MAQLCAEVGANRRTVDRRFRAVRGHTLLAEMNLCRCRRAKHFLEMTDLPIKSICWLAGFGNTEQMRVTFLQLDGMSPSRYRDERRRSNITGISAIRQA